MTTPSFYRITTGLQIDQESVIMTGVGAPSGSNTNAALHNAADIGSLYLQNNAAVDDLNIWYKFQTTTGTVADWVQVASKTYVDNSGGGGTALKLYKENPVSPAANTVTGQNAFAIGEDNTASGQDSLALGVTNTASALGSVAMGNNAVADFPGQVSFAGGKFVVPGDAQASNYIFRGVTGTQFPMEIFLDGSSQRLTLTDNSAMTFTALAVARRTDVVGDYASFRVEGMIKRDTGMASTAIVGETSTDVITRTQSTLNIAINANIDDGALRVNVTGTLGATYNWVVRLMTVEEIG
jgi:hypothetical protein